jgi:hypothetical protein
MGRRKKRRLTQLKDNLEAKSVPNIKTQKRGFCSPQIIHDLNLKKGLRKKRKRDKKDLQQHGRLFRPPTTVLRRPRQGQDGRITPTKTQTKKVSTRVFNQIHLIRVQNSLRRAS